MSCSSAGKESACNARDPGLIPGSGRSPGEGTGYPLQYSWASLVTQTVKSLPAMRETWVRSLGWEVPWRRAWQPTPVFLPGEPHGQRSLAGCGPCGHEEPGATKRPSTELPCRVQLLSGVSVTPRPAPLSMGFSQQEHWNGLSFPPPGDLPDPGVEHASPKSHALQADSSL